MCAIVFALPSTYFLLNDNKHKSTREREQAREQARKRESKCAGVKGKGCVYETEKSEQRERVKKKWLLKCQTFFLAS